MFAVTKIPWKYKENNHSLLNKRLIYSYEKIAC